MDKRTVTALKLLKEIELLMDDYKKLEKMGIITDYQRGYLDACSHLATAINQIVFQIQKNQNKLW